MHLRQRNPAKNPHNNGGLGCLVRSFLYSHLTISLKPCAGKAEALAFIDVAYDTKTQFTVIAFHRDFNRPSGKHGSGAPSPDPVDFDFPATLQYITDHLDKYSSVPTIFGGDFNAALGDQRDGDSSVAPALDAEVNTKPNQAGVQLARAVQAAHLKNIFGRSLSATGKCTSRSNSFTQSRQPGSSAASAPSSTSIDHIFVNTAMFKRTLQAWYVSVDELRLSTDHAMLCVEIGFRKPAPPTPAPPIKTERICIAKLKDIHKLAAYQSALQPALTSLHSSLLCDIASFDNLGDIPVSHLSQTIDSLHALLLHTAKETLGSSRSTSSNRSPSNPWWDSTCRNLLHCRNAAKRKFGHASAEYVKAQADAARYINGITKKSFRA